MALTARDALGYARAGAVTPLRRLLPSAAAGRFVPVPEKTGVGDRAPLTDVAPQEIEPSLKRGAVWAFGSQIAVQAIRFGGVIVLARLLTPEDYGAAALAITVASFSMILGDLGYGTALVQASSASQRWASTTFWCALGAGILGTVCVALAAYPAALALDAPQVTGLLIAGGLTLLLVGVGATSNALLARAMNFGVIQSAGVAAAVLATICAITAAALGAGAWALVLQQLVLAGVSSAVFIVAARWRPSLGFSRAAFGWLSRFAIPRTGGHGFGILQALVPVLLIGHLLGIDELGIWNLSMALVLVPLTLLATPIAQVIYAAFARMRDNPVRVAEVWLSGFVLLAAVVLPTLCGLIAVAPDLIPFVFGAQWAPAVPVVQILGIFVMARTLQAWNTAVMDAAGKPHVSMILNATVLIALPPAIWLGSSFGLEGVAVAFSLAALLCGELPSFLLTTRELSLRGINVLRRIRAVALSAVAAGLGVVFVRQALVGAGVAIEARIPISILVGAGVYVTCVIVFARGTAVQVIGTARRLRAGRA